MTSESYSPLKQIDTTNVSRLGLEWSFDVGAGGGQQEATPLVWNNTIYKPNETMPRPGTHKQKSVWAQVEEEINGPKKKPAS